MNLDSSKIPSFSPEQVQELYALHQNGLMHFLVGILRDHATAADVLQITFTKLLEKGHLVQQQESMKSWLFRVAFNEAMLVKRKSSVKKRHAEAIAWKIDIGAGADKGNDPKLSQSVHYAIQQENVQSVKAALEQLSESYRVVVQKRIFEGLKFREIAEELDVPLGTVLARMQAALKKLKPLLSDLDDLAI